MRVWITWQVQIFADIREQLKYNWFSMSGWQYGEQHILAIHDCEQGFLLMFGETFNLWKTLLEYRSQTFFEDTVRNNPCRTQANLERVQTENWSILQTNSFVERQNLPREVQWRISPPSPRYYQSNEPIILIWLFVKLSTHPSLKVRFKSKVTRGFSFSPLSFASRVFTASRLSRSSLMWRKIKKNLWDQGIDRLGVVKPNQTNYLPIRLSSQFQTVVKLKPKPK